MAVVQTLSEVGNYPLNAIQILDYIRMHELVPLERYIISIYVEVPNSYILA